MPLVSFIKKQFSVESITRKSALLAERFPISVLLLAFLAALLFVKIAGDTVFHSSSYRLYLFLSIGVFISVTAALWLEDFAGRWAKHLITALITSLWGVYCAFLPEVVGWYGKAFSMNKGLELAAIGTAAFLAMFFISFLKKDKDRACWNFITCSYDQLFLALIFGMVIQTGLSGAVFAVSALFDVYTGGHRIYVYLSIFSYVLFSPLYFLSNIPNKEAKQNEEVLPNRTLKIFGLYILSPLAAAYIVILYLYLFKIIFAWELPRGLVSWLVSALAYSGLIIIICLYPARLLEKNRIINFISRCIGLIILPLLILMSVGIHRRVSDYGLTVARGYLILQVLWFYGIYAHIFITKAMRVRWILISFTALLLLSSVTLWGVPNITKHILLAEIKSMLPDKQKIPLALPDADFFDRMGEDDKRSVSDKIAYLSMSFGDESLRPLFDDGVDISGGAVHTFLWALSTPKTPSPESRRDGDGKSGHDETRYEVERFFRDYRLDDRVQQVGTFNAFVHIRYFTSSGNRDITYSASKDTLTIRVIPDDRTFHIPLRELAQRFPENSEAEANAAYINTIEYDNGLIMFSELRWTYHKAADSVAVNRLNGFLFYNR